MLKSFVYTCMYIIPVNHWSDRACDMVITVPSDLKDQLGESASQTSTDDRAGQEEWEADLDLVDKRLEERVHDAHADVAPGAVLGVLVAVTSQRQSNSDSIENSGLLVQVVEVVRDEADVRRDLGVHLLLDLCWVGGDLVLGNGRNASGVHPSLHGKSPSCHSRHRAEEGSAVKCEGHD